VPEPGKEGQPTPPESTGTAGNVSTGGEPGSTAPTGKEDVIAAADDVLKGEQPASPGGGGEDERPATGSGLAQATPTVQAAGTGSWASLGVAFFDFQRVAEGIDAVTADSVEKAISALPADKAAGNPVIRTWLKKKRHEWRFAGAKAAEIADDASFAPDLLQAARATAADPGSSSKPNSLAALTLKAITKPLEKYASIEMAAELLAVASDENTQWAADVLMALRRRSPDITDRAVRERVLAMETDALQATIPFLSTVGAWGSELSETLVDQGLKSDDRAVQLRFVDLCKRLELKSAKNQLVNLMNSSPSAKVKKAAEEALTALGVPVKESSETGKLVQQFVYGSDEERKKVFAAVEATGQREELQTALAAQVASLADKFFGVLRDAGRERLLTEFYHPQSPILSGGEEKGFDQQRECEEYVDDYRGAWPEHAWLLESALAVGLLPKNKEIVNLMEQGKPDEHGTPSWLRNGPIIIFKPQEGDWRIYAITKISYAFQFTKTLRRHQEEMEGPDKKQPAKP
jgi:hypothetical protein